MCWERKSDALPVPYSPINRDGVGVSMQDSDNPESNQPTAIIKQGLGSVQSEDYASLSESPVYVCRWRFCLLWCVSVLIIVVVVIILVIYYALIPSLAQQSVNNSTMDLIAGKMSNPTANSVDLSTTIIVSNTGMFPATIYAHRGELWIDGQPMGSIHMSEIHTEANKPTTITLNTTLNVTNTTLFQASCRGLLNGADQTWQLITKHQEIQAKVGGIEFTTHVHLNKSLFLPGAPMLDMQTNNVRVTDADETTITAVSDIRFRSNSIIAFDLPPCAMDIYMNDEWVASAPLAATTMKAGLNMINDTVMTITKSATNQNALDGFFSTFISGYDQFALMKGPSGTADGQPLVIDGVLEQYVSVEGNNAGPVTFGGAVTRVTQAGWETASGETVRGAYADVYNSLDVPLRMTNVSANLNLLNPLRFNMTLLLGEFVKFSCYPEYTHGLATIGLGSGTWKDNLTKTWADVPPKSRKTMFVHAGPQEDQKGDSCLHLFPFPCCWAAITPAAICQINPQFMTDMKDQATYDYIPTWLEGNFTTLVNKKFEMTIYYKLDFFPLYYGYEVYDGTLSDVEMNCNDFVYY